MELRDAINGRRATRNFLQTAVTRAAITSLIDAAVQAPNAMNGQPWHFTAIRNASLLADIAATAKAHALKMTANNQHVIQLHDVLILNDYDIFYHAPALVIISVRSGAWAVEDGALAAENLMLAAHETGLGSCWIGFAQAWLATREGRGAIGLPEEYTPVAPIIIGYPATPAPAISRKLPRIAWFE